MIRLKQTITGKRWIDYVPVDSDTVIACRILNENAHMTFFFKE